MGGLDERGVLEGTPRELGEGLAVGENALGLHLEATLLRHGGVPDVVRGEERAVKQDIRRGRELVFRGVVASHVDDGVDVRLCLT